MCCVSDVRAAQDPRVHVPHGLLRLHRDRAVGRSDDLQDAPQLHCPPGHDVSDANILLNMDAFRRGDSWFD